jgi:drug/metabolite transporter (DMT)-like permease
VSPPQHEPALKRVVAQAYASPIFLLALVSLFWAGNQIVGRAMAGEIPPIMLGCLRWMIATLVILPFAWPALKADWSIVRANLPFLAFLGVIGGGAINTLSYIGLNYTTAMNALVLNSAAPILIVLFCYLIFGDRIAPLQALGIATSLTGVLAVILHGDLGALASMSLNRGDVLIVLGMASWGIYTAFLRRRPAIAPLTLAAVTFAAAGLVNLPLAIGESMLGYAPRPSLATALAIPYVGLFPSVIAYLFYNRAVELIGGTRAGAFTHLVPLFGAILAFVFLGERPGLYHAVGFALILIGVWLASRSTTK